MLTIYLNEHDAITKIVWPEIAINFDKEWIAELKRESAQYDRQEKDNE